MKRQDAWVKGIGKKRMRILAGMLGFCVLVTTCPDMPAPRSVSAAEEMTETGEQYISGFAQLSEEIREQTVPVGTALEELTLPDTLEAVVTAAGESQPPEDTEDQPGDDGKEDAGENDGKEDGGAFDGESGDGETDDKEDDGTTGGEGGTEEGEPSGTEQEDARNGYGTDAETAENGAGESVLLEERGGRAAVRESASTVERQDSGAAQKTHTVTLPEYYAEHVISVQTLENIQTEAQVDSEKKEKEETAAEEHQEPQKKAQEETHTVSGITWQSAPAYDGNTEGIYTFTAVLPEGYALAEGVSLPEITVTVQEIVRRAMARAAMAASDWGGTGVREIKVDGNILGYGNNLTITQGSTADTTKLYYTSGTELIGPIDLSPAEGSIADGFHTEQCELCTTGGQVDYSSLDIIVHMEGGVLKRISTTTSNTQPQLSPKNVQFFMSGGTLLEEDGMYATYVNVVDISGESVIKGKLNGYADILVSGSPQIGGEGKGIFIASGNKFTVKGALSNASIYVNPQANFADGTKIAQAASGYTITESDLAQMTLTGSHVEGKELYLENNAIYIRVKPEVPHTVTYNYSANGGTSATKTSDTVLEGAAADLTPTATKSGWEFVGWNTEQNAHAGFTTLTMGEEDITLYAIYKKTLTASFYSGSAGVKETVSTTIYNNATVGSVKAPAMKTWAETAESGYTAWHYSSGEFSGKNIDPGKTVSLSLAAGEVSYYGLYKKNITVSYDANGGTGSADSKTVERQASVHEKVAYWTTPSVTLHDGAGFVRNGYTFNGWIAGSPNGTNIVKAGTSVRPTGDTVYYASWKPNTYTVTLDTNGGSGGTNLTSYTYGIEKVLPTDWTKTGYTFAGWYTDSGFAGTAVTKITATDTGVKTYYAKWTPNTYTVTYNINNGTIANESNYTSYTYGTGLTLPTPTRTGYTFDGWYENAGFTGNKVTGISTTATGGKTYYAKWTANTYTVTYNNDSGTIANESAYTKYTYGTGLTLPTPARRGYSFSGWYDNVDCTGTAVTAISTTDIGDKTFYAKWTDDIAPVIGTLRYSYKPANLWRWLIGKDSLIITVPVIEEGSGVDEITYTVTPESGVAEEKTAALTNGTAKITVSADFKGKIWIVCTDKAGNVAADVTVGASLNAEGVIIEDNAPDIVIKADRSSSDTQQTQPGGVAVEDRYYETVPALLVTVRDDMDNAITGGLDTIAYQVGNGEGKPVTFDRSTLQKAAQAAFTIPASEIPAGITEITVTAVDNAGNRAAKALTIKVKGTENKPAAEIDYRKEKLTGLAAGGTYRINDTEYTADGEGCIPIKEEWMGTTVTVVKAGSGSETTDSPAQNLPIPARPAKPKPTGEDVAVPGGTGKLTGLAADTAYEISTDGGKTWVSRRADGNGVITGLAPGAYTVRVEVGASNFASENSSPARIGAYQIKVTFVVEGETYKEVFVDYGGTLADIPPVPPVEDAVGAWCSDRQGTPAVFTNITADMTVYAVYTHYYTVTLQGGAGYTLTAETGSESPVKEGGSFTFRFALGKGYQKTKNFAVKVNGAAVELTAAEPYTYTISNIRAHQTVTVEGVEKKPGGNPSSGSSGDKDKGDGKDQNPDDPASNSEEADPDNRTPGPDNPENQTPKPDDQTPSPPVTPPANQTPPAQEADAAPGTTPPAERTQDSRPGSTPGQRETGTPEGTDPETEGTGAETQEADSAGDTTGTGGADVQTLPTDGTAAGMTEGGVREEKAEVNIGNGKVIVTVVYEEEKCTAAVADAEAVAKAVLKPQQQAEVNGGETIEIRVDVTDISEKVPEQDKEVIESGVEVYREETPGLVLGMYVDISMFIKIGEGDWNAIATTDEPIEVVIGIPEKLQSDDREFYIIRAHEGEHTLLRDLDGAPDTITVSTDMFSSYAIAYEETEGAGADRKCGLCHICPTFLGICYFIWLAVILAVAGIVIYVVLRSRKEEETEGEK